MQPLGYKEEDTSSATLDRLHGWILHVIRGNLGSIPQYYSIVPCWFRNYDNVCSTSCLGLALDA